MEVTKEQREELRAEWVKALRSGEFKQCEGVLENAKGENCCLGVACRVFERMFPGVLWIEPTAFGDVRFDDHRNTLPETVWEALGVQTSAGKFGGISLWQLNDTDHKTFVEIADVIESRPPGLFVDDPAATASALNGRA